MEATPYWEGAHTFDDWLIWTRLFLQGDAQNTPCHHGPLCSESRTILPALLTLNARGVMSTDSQPSGTFIDQWATGEYRVTIQRGYVEFMVEKGRVGGMRDFALRMLQRGLEYVVYDYDANEYDAYVTMGGWTGMSQWPCTIQSPVACSLKNALAGPFHSFTGYAWSEVGPQNDGDRREKIGKLARDTLSIYARETGAPPFHGLLFAMAVDGTWGKNPAHCIQTVVDSLSPEESPVNTPP